MYFAQVWDAFRQELQIARARLVQRANLRKGKPLLLERLEDRTLLTGWTPIGPAPIDNGQIAGNGPVSGRITGVATDPHNADIVFVATAGGGIWKTTDATAASPIWTPLTDNLTDASGNPLPEFMGAVAVTDATSGAHSGSQIVYAGMGEANNNADGMYGDGILVSTDGGATWTLTDAGGALTGRTISKIVADPSDLTGATAYAAVSDLGTNGKSGNTGIWKTTNYGQTWTNTTAAAPNNLSTLNSWSDVVIDPHTPSTVYAAMGNANGDSANGVYKSMNGGLTWSLLNGPGTFNGIPDGRISLALYDDGITNELFVSIERTGGSLYKMLESKDGGASFTDLTSKISNYLGDQGDYDTTLAIDPQNANFIYAAGDMAVQGFDPSGNFTGIFSGSPVESFDGGATWHDIAMDPVGNGPHTDAHAVAFDAGGNLLEGDDGGIFKLANPTSQANQHWIDLNSNLQITQFTGIAVDPTNGNVYGGSQDNGTEKYTGAQGWTNISPGDGGMVRVDPTNHNVVYAERSSASLSVSLDGGKSFNFITRGLRGNAVNFYAPYALDSSGNIYYGADWLNLSTNHGATWSAIGQSGINNFNPTDSNIDAVAVSPTNNNVVYVSAGGHVFVTQNAQAGGTNVTWAQIDLPGGWGTDNFFSGTNQDMGAFGQDAIAVDQSDPTGATAYAVVPRFTGGGNHVFKTHDFGAHWIDLSANLPDVPCNAVAVSPDGGMIYVGTDVGVYSMSNGGTTWSRVGTGLPDAMVTDLQLVPSLHLIVAGTHGRGAWELSTAPGLTVTTPTITAGVAYSNTGSPTLSGTVTDNSGTGIASVMLSIDGNPPVAAIVNGSNWSYHASGLSDGAHSISIVANDNASEASAPVGFTLKVDTLAPSVIVMTPAAFNGVAYANTATQTISGTVSDGASSSGIACVALTIDGQSPVFATVSNGTWTYNAALADGIHTISVAATDNAGNTGTPSAFTFTVDTVRPTVTVTSPTVTNGTATVTTNTPTLSGLVTDPNPSSGIACVLVSIDGGEPLTATVNGANWTWSGATLSNGNHSVSVSATDNAGNTSSFNFTLQVVHSNALSLTIPPGPLTYTAQGAPVNVAAGATVIDGASNFNNGSLTVGITRNADPNDRLTLVNQGFGAGKISVLGSAVYYGFSSVGTISGGSNGAPLVINFSNGYNATATAAIAQAIVQDIQFSNTAVSPSSAQRTVEFQLTDGIHQSSGPVDVAVNVSVPHVAPAIHLNTTGITYNSQSPPQQLAPAGTVTAGSATNFSGGSLTVSITAFASADDCLQVLNVGQISVSAGSVFYGTRLIGNISGGTAGSPLVISLTSLADATATGALVKAIAYQNGSTTPWTNPRTVQFQLNDGAGNVSIPVTETVKVVVTTSVSISPANSSISYALGSPDKHLFAGATFSATGLLTFAGSKLVVSSSQFGDRVKIQSNADLEVAGGEIEYKGQIIGYLLNNTVYLERFASVQSIQALIRSYTFSTTGPTGSRVVTFSFTDANGDAATATVNVNVTGPINLGGAATVRHGRQG